MKKCYVCNKEPISKIEIGLSKKLVDNTGCFYCIDCLAEYLELTTDDLLDRVEYFKSEGCKLFS